MINAPGLIDAGYRGEISVILINHDRNEDFEISKGDRIAQLMLQEVSSVNWHQVEKLPGSMRGDGGFGSSGIKG
jgi:dUTP pyrophosphatase